MHTSPVRPALLAVLTLTAALLTGCGVGTLAPGTPESVAGPAVSGGVHGGQQPVAGAHVYLFQAGSGSPAATSLFGNTVGASGFAAVVSDSANPAGVGSDAAGNDYVLTAADGSFTFNPNAVGAAVLGKLYTCTAGRTVYALALTGNSGSGASNPNLALMAVLGPCPSSGSFSSSEYLFINEVTTVAAVYALAGYMTGPEALGTPDTSALALTGITNAANNAAQLANLATGTALTTTPNGNGIVPTAAIDTLANILAACVNSNGTGTGCTTLFNNATRNGIPVNKTGAGAAPTDTVTALLNIAHNTGVLAQYTGAMSAIYGLQTATSPFGNALTTVPNDFTLSITFQGRGLFSPGVPAVDAAGNVWFGSSARGGGGYIINRFSPLGVAVYASPGQQGVVAFTVNPVAQAAIDPTSGLVWFAQTKGGVVTSLDPNEYFAQADTQYNGNSTDDGHQIALDTTGGVLVNDFTNGYAYLLTTSGSVNTPFQSSLGSLDVAVLSSSADINFLSQYDGLSAFSSNYTYAGGGPPLCGAGVDYCAGGGIAAPTALAVDSGAYIWALNNSSSLSKFDSSATTTLANGAVSPSTGYTGGGLNTKTRSPTQPMPWLAMDGGGNVWVANYTGGVSEFSNAGTAITPAYTSASLPGGYFGSAPTCKGQGLAIDGSGDVWVSCDSSTAPVLEYIGAATPVYTPLTPGHFGVTP